VSGPSEIDVRGWIAEVETEAQELEARLAPLLDKKTALEERLGILRRLLASISSDSGSYSTQGANGHGSDADKSVSVRERVIRHAAEILREGGGTMHINDIHAEFIRRGYEVPGAGKPVNITVHLSGAENIASPSRGQYALVRQDGSATRHAVRDDSRVRGEN
jgi:hypothetical protein